MPEIFDGTVAITPVGESDATIVLDGDRADVHVGGGIRRNGTVNVLDVTGALRIELNASNNRIRCLARNGEVLAEVGPSGNITLGGGGGHDGDLILRDAKGTARIHLDAGNHRMILRDESGHEFGRLGDFGNLKLGSGGHDGDILLYPSKAANMSRNEDATIHLDPNAGDITLRNADCAEEFRIAPDADATPGTVMTLADDGSLRPTGSSHDRCVVGVVSGAGDYKPGIVLDRQPGASDRSPIALVGKTFVRVCDEAGRIQVGDLLTSSSRTGVAMRASDPVRAFGAIIGKAIAPHSDSNEGLIPMLIALQ